MPAGKRAGYRLFSMRKIVEWTLPLLLSLWALVVLVTASGVGRLHHRNSFSKPG